jgi:predicted Zn-dependent peptidase
MTISSKSYEKITLPNGVRLILVPMVGVNSIATSVMVAVGSRYETPEINGVSHFLEHMVFKGTQKFPTTDDVNAIERVGGIQNAYTDIDITNFHNKVLSTDWPLALEINKELALAPRIEQQYIDKERDVILEEKKRYDDELSSLVGNTFHHMMYPDAPLGMRIIGETKSLLASNASTLHAYHDAWYKPPQIVVVLAGRVTSHVSRITNQVNEWFGPLSGKPEKDFLPVTHDSQESPKLDVVTKPDAQQSHITLGLRTFRRGSSERFAWGLFNLIMGVSFTSRLFKEVREKRGLCYHIQSSSDTWADVGYWSIYAGVATEKVEETVQAILVELAKAVDSGVTDDELVVAKKRLKTILAFKSEDPEFMGEYYGRQELFHEPIMTLDDYINAIDNVSKEDINALTKKYLITRNLNMALVTSKPRDEHLLELLQLTK